MTDKTEINNFIKMNSVNPKDLTKEHWLEDFNNFYNIMKDNFPYFWVKERMLGYNWLDLKNKYLTKLEEAEDVQEILPVFWDAVIALQDTHTSIYLPHWMGYQFREGSFFQKNEPYKTIFSDTLKNANEYLKPMLEESYNRRAGINYNVLILYNKGDYLIVDGCGDWQEKYGPYGTKILAVNDTPVDTAIKITFEKETMKWDYALNKPYQIYIDPTFFGPTAVFTIETPDGKIKKTSFEASMNYNYPPILKYPTEWVTTKIWPEKKIAYIRFKNFELNPENEEHYEFLLAFYKNVKDFNYLIIDVCGNSGGFYEVWEKNVIAPLIKKRISVNMYVGFRKGTYVNFFRKYKKLDIVTPKEKFSDLPPEVKSDDFTIYDLSKTIEPTGDFNFNAKIIVLTDSFTWSASAAFALFCKESKLAKIYGKPTKGEAVSSGTIFYILPNSKIAIRFNPCIGLNSLGQAIEEVKIQPDVFYEPELNNQNELLNFVLKELEK